MNLTVTKYDNANAFEAVWWEEIPAPEPAEGEDRGKPQAVQVRCIAYSDDQIDMFRADVAQYGGDLELWESLLAEVEAARKPPEPPPPPPVPRSVTMRQARLALLAVGKLDDVDAAIAMISDPLSRKVAQIEWEYSSTVNRDHQWVQQLAQALGFTDDQLDSLFVAADGM